MSLTLFLLRHAEAQSAQSNQRDFDRELSPKGVQQCIHLGKKMDDLKISADYIICSPAMRAKTTALTVVKSFKESLAKIQFTDSIYEADADGLMSIIQAIDNKSKHVLLVGHNPAISILSNYLDNDFKEGMGTCDLVWIEFKKSSWNEIHKHSGKVKEFIRS